MLVPAACRVLHGHGEEVAFTPIRHETSIMASVVLRAAARVPNMYVCVSYIHMHISSICAHSLVYTHMNIPPHVEYIHV